MQDAEEIELDLKLSENPKHLVLYESPQILELRREIDQLKTEMRRVHYVNMAGRIAWVLFNPSAMVQNHAKDWLFWSLKSLATRFFF